VAVSLVSVEQITGEELFSRYVATGDGGAFEELVRLYEDELARFINGIVRDFHEAKHLTVETFAQLAVNGKKFSGKSSLKTYLFTIGKNLAVKYLKKRGRERHISFEDAVTALADADDSPFEIMEREESKRQVHKAMGALKEEYRAVLLLLYFEDMSYLEAGKAMRKSSEQVKHLAYRAKAALKKKLEGDGYQYA